MRNFPNFSEHKRQQIASIFQPLSIVTLHSELAIPECYFGIKFIAYGTVLPGGGECLCNFYPRCCSFTRKMRRAKNAMNNFKVRVIKQQWRIIKHHATPTVTGPSIATSNRLHNIRVVIGRFSCKFSRNSRCVFFLDIFACVQRENRRPQRDESKEKRIFFKLKMHRTLMHKKKRLRQAKKYIRRKIHCRN